MPPLVSFCRRWEFGSDDLVFPGLILVSIRAIWLVLQVIGIAIYYKPLLNSSDFTLQDHHDNTSPCADFFVIVAFMSVTITLSILILESAIVWVSSRGTILNTYPRRHLPYLLYVRMILFVVEILALIAKTVLAAMGYDPSCPFIGDGIILVRIIVVVTWLMFIGMILAVILYLDPCHLYSVKVNFSSKDKHVENEDDRAHDNTDEDTLIQDETHHLWEKRLQIICCFAGSDESKQTAYKEVAAIFAHIFSNDNLVPSDIAAGLILIQKRHLEHEMTLMSVPDNYYPPGSIEVNFHDLEERKLFSDSLHFLKFALSVYSWPIYLYMNPLSGWCKLCSRASLCRSNRVRTNIHNDNSCFCGAAGFVSVAEINEVDIIYAQFDNDLYRLPFVVCLDHDTGSVVVTVRGTLSMHDIITDLIANVHPIELPGWPMFMVHKGMYQSALYIKELLEDGVLELAFDKAPQYKLVIAGHSLGSGCACILAILLQEEFPDVHCYCFSPSGSLLNATAAIYTQSFVTSVTLGQDVVCRLNVVTANKMKHQVIKALETCRKPKYRIMFEGVLETLGKCCGRDVLFKDVEDNETDSSPDELPLIDDEDHIVLYPPGRVIHIVDTLRERRCFFAQRHLEAQWASAGNFQDITVSPDMLKDHFPDVLFRAMKVIWEEKQNELSNIAII